MKILIIAGIFPPDIGGPAQYVPKIADALIKKGHTVTVLCFSGGNVDSKDLELAYKVRRVLRHTNLIMRELGTILTGIQLARSCDVIYANGNDFKAFLIGVLTSKKRVHKIVGDTSWERAQNRNWFKGTIDEYQTSKKSFKLKILDWVRTFPLLHSYKIITPSFYLKSIVKQWRASDSRIEVIYNSFQALPENEQKPDILKILDPSLTYMCTICRLVPWKGVDQLVKVLTDFPKLGLIIVGDGPLKNKLESVAQDLGVCNRVIFAGRQSRNDIKNFLDASKFFILNSSYEGLPHVVLEAMSCRKLVLATRVGGTPEVVKNDDTGLLFEYGNYGSLKEVIRKATESNNDKIIDSATHFIEKSFSFEKMINNTEDVLLSACHK